MIDHRLCLFFGFFYKYFIFFSREKFFFFTDVSYLDEPCIVRCFVDAFRCVQKLFVDSAYCACYRGVNIGSRFNGLYIAECFANGYFVAFFRQVYEYQISQFGLCVVGQTYGSNVSIFRDPFVGFRVFQFRFQFLDSDLLSNHA